VLKIVALVLQRITRRVFDLPARASTAHEFVYLTRADPQVGDPTEVLTLLANSPKCPTGVIWEHNGAPERLQ